jgi:hypothetical protein
MSVREQTMRRLCRIRTIHVAVGGLIEKEARDTGYERKAAETAGTKEEGPEAKEEEGETREAVAGMGIQVTASMAN